MSTSLRDIPGATRDPVLKRRGGRRLRRRPPALPVGPGPAGMPGLVKQGKKRTRLFERRRRINPVDLLIACLALGLALFFGRAAWSATRVDAEVTGVADGALLTAEQAEHLALRMVVSPSDRLGRARLTLDGIDVSRDAVSIRGGLRWVPTAPLSEGTHVLELAVPRPLLPDSRFRWAFTVDGTPPELAVPRLAPRAAIDEPVTISGRVDPAATLFVDGQPVETDGGAFTLEYPHPPAGPVSLEAVDPAGNRAAAEVIVPIEYEPSRAVHVTAAAWDHDELRAGIMQLIDAGKVDAVELDIKDEGGVVGHASNVALARRSGASKEMYDLEEAVDVLHAKGVRVIGRLVAFRDPILAEEAWEAGNADWLIQTPDGEPHPSYGGFTNFAHPEVRRYNIDLAVEAVEAGVDEILYDYVRRPEGSLDGMVVPGLVGTPEDGIVDFLARSHEVLRRAGVPQGASLFGVAADRPWTVGQNVPRIGRHVDYVAPMLYPSLWVKGEYRVEDPVRQPYEIVKRSLADFQEKLDGTGAVLVPWLQDFSLGAAYGPAEVRAQIQAAADLGVHGFLLWNPLTRYTADALDQVVEPGAAPVG